MHSSACRSDTSTNKKKEILSEQSVITDIKKMEKERLAAGIRKNLAFYDSTTATDYLQIDIDGRVLDKVMMLERVKSSYAQLQSNETDDELVRVYGNTAILTARGHPRGIMQGKEFTDDIRYTRIYVKRNDLWQIVFFQQTRVNPAK